MEKLLVTNAIIMSMLNKPHLSIILLLSCLIGSVTQAAELTGRFSMLGSTAQATQGDFGYINKNNLLTADQQSLRLMLDETLDDGEWSLHLKTARVHVSDFLFQSIHSSDLFRYDKLAHNWLEESDATSTTRLGYQVDRAFYKQRFNKMTLSLGRQPIDWGSGRFWQPLNVFGAFAPTDLDTDFKPGIDAARLDWFPSDYSSLTAVYAFSDKDNAALENKNSAAIHYRKQVGEQSELALVAGNVIGNRVYGASFEGSTTSIGWRVEALNTNLKTSNENFTFLIAGLDHQFSNGMLLTAEWYNNSRGANDITTLINTNLQTDALILYGLQQHLSQNVLGISLYKEISPLITGSYTLLASPLKDVDGSVNTSILHQFNISYSVSNESDLLFSLQFANGRGLNLIGQPQSEFGHTPASMAIRLRFYF